MKLHILKIKDKYIKEVLSGKKTCEVRINDRDYKIGDIIHFIKVDGTEFIDFSNLSKNTFLITHIISNEDIPTLDNYVVLSIKKLY